jgi:hypothetical protein
MRLPRPIMTTDRTPRVVYFVLSHANVPQVLRLIGRIRRDVPESLVLVHHDATTEPFAADAFAQDAHVYVLPRSIHGEWASYALVEIALYGLDELHARGIAYDYVVLLSGQDYPIADLRGFEVSLAASGDGFIETDPNPGTLLDRYRFAWMRFPRALEHGVLHRIIGFLTRWNARQRYLRFLSGRVGCRIAYAPQRLPLGPGMEVCKGTQWWALSARAIAFVRAFVAENPAFVRHYREHTIMPDESFFHTILSDSSAQLSFVNDDRRFTKWATGSSASPEILRLRDLDAICASGAAFARKFDTRVDAAILDALDQRLET